MTQFSQGDAGDIKPLNNIKEWRYVCCKLTRTQDIMSGMGSLIMWTIGHPCIFYFH